MEFLGNVTPRRASLGHMDPKSTPRHPNGAIPPAPEGYSARAVNPRGSCSSSPMHTVDQSRGTDIPSAAFSGYRGFCPLCTNSTISRPRRSVKKCPWGWLSTPTPPPHRCLVSIRFSALNQPPGRLRISFQDPARRDRPFPALR